MVEQPSPCNIERIVKKTWTHVATNDDVIPQVLQSPRNFPMRSKATVLQLHGSTLQLQPCIKN
jgi:hypothetical protein